MKLDMDEINKLNPPGLLNLRPMLFVVEVMMGLIAKEVPGSRMMLKLVRALGRYQKQVRDDEAYNLNVRIKAWVMAQAARRAWVRGIIGEAAIKRWQWQRDNLYGVREDAETNSPTRHTRPRGKPKLNARTYKWKRFAMANLSWLRTGPLDVKSLGQGGMTSTINWSQPRESRGFKPVEFYAFELADNYEPPELVKPNADDGVKQQDVNPEPEEHIPKSNSLGDENKPP